MGVHIFRISDQIVHTHTWGCWSWSYGDPFHRLRGRGYHLLGDNQSHSFLLIRLRNTVAGAHWFILCQLTCNNQSSEKLTAIICFTPRAHNSRSSVVLRIYLGCVSCWYVTSIANITNVLISRDSFKPQVHFITLLKILLTNPVSWKSVLVQSFIEYSPCPVYDPQLMHWPPNVISLKPCGTSVWAPVVGRQVTESLYYS